MRYRFTCSFERVARFTLSGWTLIAAVLFYISSLIPADDGQRGMDAEEHLHVEQALAFVNANAASRHSLPGGREFDAWTSEMDRHGYRYDGKGFTYTRVDKSPAMHEKPGCWDSVNSGTFKFSFWDGEKQINIYPNRQHRYFTCSAPENYSFGLPIPFARIAFLMAICMLIISFWRSFRFQSERGILPASL